MDRPPIETTLQSIDRGYQPGTLAWLKMKRPEESRKMIAIEAEINRAAIQGDEVGLTKALNEYEGFISKMVEAFKTPRGETGSLF